MAIRSDVLVVGGGIAGLMAGISATTAGATVTVVTASESTLRQASGLIDILGYVERDEDPVVDPLEACNALAEDHPYRVIGRDAIESGMAGFDRAVGDLYRGSSVTRNALIPTAAGTIKPTARYQTTMEPGLVSDPRDTVIVGFERLPALDGPLAAAWMSSADCPFAVRGETCAFPGSFRTDAAITRYAHALDQNESLPTEDGDRPGREALAETLQGVVGEAERIGVPAMLGLEHPETVRSTVSDSIGADVFEIPTGPPSIPGMRLATQLTRSLQEEGGRFHTGAAVVDFETDGERIDRVQVDRNDSLVPYEADEYILATGGLVGKGIRASRERVREPVFDCWVSQPDDRYDWFVDEVFGEQPYPRFGVSIDETLRPQNQSGAVEYPNLRAAGSVIGGYDFGAELSGSGVSIATGWDAGSRAGGGV